MEAGAAKCNQCKMHGGPCVPKMFCTEEEMDRNKRKKKHQESNLSSFTQLKCRKFLNFSFHLFVPINLFYTILIPTSDFFFSLSTSSMTFTVFTNNQKRKVSSHFLFSHDTILLFLQNKNSQKLKNLEIFLSN